MEELSDNTQSYVKLKFVWTSSGGIKDDKHCFQKTVLISPWAMWVDSNCSKAGDCADTKRWQIYNRENMLNYRNYKLHFYQLCFFIQRKHGKMSRQMTIPEEWCVLQPAVTIKISPRKTIGYSANHNKYNRLQTRVQSFKQQKQTLELHLKSNIYWP